MVTGLQNFINNANHYTTENIPLFNAIKTSCVTFGKCSLECLSWHINSTELSLNDYLDYLGAI